MNRAHSVPYPPLPSGTHRRRPLHASPYSPAVCRPAHPPPPPPSGRPPLGAARSSPPAAGSRSDPTRSRGGTPAGHSPAESPDQAAPRQTPCQRVYTALLSGEEAMSERVHRTPVRGGHHVREGTPDTCQGRRTGDMVGYDQGWNFGRFLVLLGYRRLYSLSGKYSPSIPFPIEPEVPGTQSTRLRPQFHTESLISKPMA